MTKRGLEMVAGKSAGQQDPSSGRRRSRSARKKSSKAGIWGALALVAVVLMAVAAYFGVSQLSDRLGAAEDYAGEGEGSVEITIAEGANGLDVSRQLAEADVIASSESLYRLLLADEQRASLVQPGIYEMRRQMSADSALTLLTDGSSRLVNRVTIPEGTRLVNIIDIIAENSDIAREDLLAVLEDPASIGLPAYANGSPEGYLFPATYEVNPGTTAQQVLSQMVAKTVEVLDRLDIEARAQQAGMTPNELLTLASLLEFEARLDEDYPKVARVFLNRLAIGMPLQSDATVAYAAGKEGDVWTTLEERQSDSPYNTYVALGLPPGPIGSPGEKTIEAALNPEPESFDYLYFIAIDLESGQTEYSRTYADHVRTCKEVYGAETQC